MFYPVQHDGGGDLQPSCDPERDKDDRPLDDRKTETGFSVSGDFHCTVAVAD